MNRPNKTPYELLEEFVHHFARNVARWKVWNEQHVGDDGYVEIGSQFTCTEVDALIDFFDRIHVVQGDDPRVCDDDRVSGLLWAARHVLGSHADNDMPEDRHYRGDRDTHSSASRQQPRKGAPNEVSALIAASRAHAALGMLAVEIERNRDAQ